MQPLWFVLLFVVQLADGGPASAAETAVRDRFESFALLTAQGAAAVADFYASNAKVRVVRRYADGQTRQTDYTGDKWKSLVRLATAAGKAEDYEGSTFSGIRVEPSGDFFTVRTTRLINRRCYRDEDHYQIWGRHPDGRWMIVQELRTTLTVSLCPPQSSRGTRRL